MERITERSCWKTPVNRIPDRQNAAPILFFCCKQRAHCFGLLPELRSFFVVCSAPGQSLFFCRQGWVHPVIETGAPFAGVRLKAGIMENAFFSREKDTTEIMTISSQIE